MTSDFRRALLCASTGAGIAFTPSATLAQEAAGGQADTNETGASQTADGGAFGDIIVTARRRAESL